MVIVENRSFLLKPPKIALGGYLFLLLIKFIWQVPLFCPHFLIYKLNKQFLRGLSGLILVKHLEDLISTHQEINSFISCYSHYRFQLCLFQSIKSNMTCLGKEIDMVINFFHSFSLVFVQSRITPFFCLKLSKDAVTFSIYTYVPTKSKIFCAWKWKQIDKALPERLKSRLK